MAKIPKFDNTFSWQGTIYIADRNANGHLVIATHSIYRFTDPEIPTLEIIQIYLHKHKTSHTILLIVAMVANIKRVETTQVSKIWKQLNKCGIATQQNSIQLSKMKISSY